jgi:hypothetical protein
MMQYWFRRRVPAIIAASVAVLLSGCASRPAAQTADDSVCRREAYNDPQVKALFIQAVQQGSNPPTFDFSFTTAQEDAQYAFRQAVQACMQRQGLASGGVEPVKQYPFSPLGF